MQAQQQQQIPSPQPAVPMRTGTPPTPSDGTASAAAAAGGGGGAAGAASILMSAPAMLTVPPTAAAGGDGGGSPAHAAAGTTGGLGLGLGLRLGTPGSLVMPGSGGGGGGGGEGRYPSPLSAPGAVTPRRLSAPIVLGAPKAWQERRGEVGVGGGEEGGGWGAGEITPRATRPMEGAAAGGMDGAERGGGMDGLAVAVRGQGRRAGRAGSQAVMAQGDGGTGVATEAGTSEVGRTAGEASGRAGSGGSAGEGPITPKSVNGGESEDIDDVVAANRSVLEDDDRPLSPSQSPGALGGGGGGEGGGSGAGGAPKEVEGGTFICGVEGCGKAYGDAGGLRKHLHTHGERQFICHYEGCGKVSGWRARMVAIVTICAAA